MTQGRAALRSTSSGILTGFLSILSGLVFAASFRASDFDRADKINRLIRQMGSARFEEREDAMKSLRALGKVSLPALHQAERNEDPEIRRRVYILVRELETGIEYLRRQGVLLTIDNRIPAKPVDGVTMNDIFRDEDLIHLAELRHLRSLGLSGSHITNDGLARIGHLTSLEELCLKKTVVSDLANIRNLTKIIQLNLNESKVTDAGLAPIKKLVNLSHLSLEDTIITDAGLAHVKDLTKLRTLDLSNTRITDDGLVYLKGLSDLWYLNLNGTQITDAGLIYLRGLKKLKLLLIKRTKASDEAIRELEKHLPVVRKRAPLPKKQ